MFDRAWRTSLSLVLPALSIAGAGTVAAAAQETASRPVPFVVSAAEVAVRLGRPGVVILHVGDQAGYDAGHIPGARRIWLDHISLPRGEGLNLQMAPPAELRATFERLGVSDTSEIILYFGKDQATPTARVFVALDYLGLGDRVSYLDGGLPAWQAAGLTMTTETPVIEGGSIAAKPRPETIADIDWLMANRSKPGLAVVDARLPGSSRASRTPRGAIPARATSPARGACRSTRCSPRPAR